MIAPGTASKAALMLRSCRPIIWKPARQKPTMTAPMTAATNAPTMPPQNLSGTQTAKCQRAMPIMIQTNRLMSESRLRDSGRPASSATVLSLRALLAATLGTPGGCGGIAVAGTVARPVIHTVNERTIRGLRRILRELCVAIGIDLVGRGDFRRRLRLRSLDLGRQRPGHPLRSGGARVARRAAPAGGAHAAAGAAAGAPAQRPPLLPPPPAGLGG